MPNHDLAYILTLTLRMGLVVLPDGLDSRHEQAVLGPGSSGALAMERLASSFAGPVFLQAFRASRQEDVVQKDGFEVWPAASASLMAMQGR
mmetsp:Transcript_574/g.887  ORF Transcript_574/g.887 Transcript_574/m.887 type:complete len:91 (-) Transcript_574:1146-1418(-)